LGVKVYRDTVAWLKLFTSARRGKLTRTELRPFIPRAQASLEELQRLEQTYGIHITIQPRNQTELNDVTRWILAADVIKSAVEMEMWSIPTSPHTIRREREKVRDRLKRAKARGRRKTPSSA
jgi:hypothetical protein